jgi:uncharacterized RDD family membrane protein YckC
MMIAVTDVVDVRPKVVLRRYLQYVIDRLVVFVASLLVFALCFGLAILVAKMGARGRWLLMVPFGAWIAALIAGDLWISIWVPHRRGGATTGMRWLGLKIVTLRGAQPSLRDYFLRWFLMVVDGMFLGLLGALLIAFSPRNQRLGDMVTRTVVVRVT